MSDLAATNCGCGDDRCGCDDRCDRCDRCGNNGFFGGNCSCIIWIIILLFCCNGNSWNNGCGNGCNNGGDCCWIIIILLLLCGCGNNGFGC